jgi:hypothetical protein
LPEEDQSQRHDGHKQVSDVDDNAISREFDKLVRVEVVEHRRRVAAKQVDQIVVADVPGRDE